ncbi:C45 family autoproteolytic acyltransferase/hydrolase [candidate division KSB1 bacterium]
MKPMRIRFIPAIKQYTPGLLEEVRGISDGSGIDFNTILAFQLMDEIWLNGGDIIAEHCSSLGVDRKGDLPSLIGQTMDLEGFRHGYQAVLHIRYENSDLESFVFTCAGLIALNGMNNTNVGVCVNAMEQLNYSTEGLPVAFVARGILRKTSQDDAIKFLHDINHASPQNYVIGGPEKIYDFERSSNKIFPFTPYSGSEVIYHTNHPIVNDDYNERYLSDIKNRDLDQIRSGNSYVRYNTLEKRLGSLTGGIGADHIRSILSSRDSEIHPVSRPYINNSRVFTFGSTIMVFGEDPEFLVSSGPPEVTNYKVYKFSK